MEFQKYDVKEKKKEKKERKNEQTKTNKVAKIIKKVPAGTPWRWLASSASQGPTSLPRHGS